MGAIQSSEVLTLESQGSPLECLCFSFCNCVSLEVVGRGEKNKRGKGEKTCLV